MEEDKYKTLKQIACGVLFTAAAALGTLYAYRIIRESQDTRSAHANIYSDASGIARDNCAWFCERMKGDYEAAKDPVGAVKGDIKALEDIAKGKKPE